MLGRGRLMLEDVRRAVEVVEALVLLAERAEERTFWELLAEPAEPSESRPELVLEPEEVV